MTVYMYIFALEHHAKLLKLLNYTEAHNTERATSMRSCHGVFMDQFIFRMVLARIWIQETSQQSLLT